MAPRTMGGSALNPAPAPGGIRRTSFTAAVLAAGLVLSSSACAGAPRGPLPGPAVVDVRLSEYRIDFNPKLVKRGRVLFKARNTGKLKHQLVLVVLPQDTPPIVQQLNSPERRGVTQVASFPPKASGASGAFAVDIEANRYALICFVVDPDGKQHGAKGMATEFEIR
ncbi:MAG: hypothetical protein ACRDIU_10355 [Actinomycetota bacterium]